VLKIEPVDKFVARFPADRVTRVGGPTFEVTPETLPPPGEMRVVVLEQAR
jgi:hypothetical protein